MQIARKAYGRLRRALVPSPAATIERLRPISTDDEPVQSPLPEQSMRALWAWPETDWNEVRKKLNDQWFRHMLDMEAERLPYTRSAVVYAPTKELAATLAPHLEAAGVRVSRTAVTVDELRHIDSDDPIIVAENAENTAFREAAGLIADAIGTERQLLHPSCLAPLISISAHGSIFTYGYAGAGNVIAQTILREISESCPRPWHVMHSWCVGGHIAVQEALTAAFQEVGAFRFGIGYAEAGYINGHAQFDATTHMVLPRIPSQMYAAEKVYGTHANPTRDGVRLIREANGKIALVLRHPLDVLVSMAAKSATGFEDRDAQTRAYLDVAEVYDTAVREQTSFLRAAATLNNVVVTRYEDLMADPRAEVDRLCAAFGRELPAAKVDHLVSLVGTTDLGHGKHLFKPGVEKWLRYIPPHRLAQARELMEAAKAFGYAADLPDEAGAPLDDYLSPYADMYCLSDPEVRGLSGKRNTFATAAGLEVTGTAPDIVDRWKEHVASRPLLRQLLNCLAYQSPRAGQRT